MLEIPWEYLFALVPGLILFIYGIQHFSEEMLRIAGKKFRKILERLTSNRVSGALLGAGFTGVVQSSNATTVIVVGLVNAGILTFVQSLGVIIGTNVGTTLTAQLIAFKLTAFAPVLILLGFLLSLIGNKYSFLGKPIFYFGLVFFSLNLLSLAIEPLKDDPGVVGVFAEFDSLFIIIVIGIIMAVMFQSSSMVTGIVILLVDSGLIGIEQGVFAIMGANIGTTLTPLMISMGMDVFARRAAAAHFLFNLGGVLIFLPFITPFVGLVSDIGGAPANIMANAHLIFNVVTALIFLVMLDPFKGLVKRLVPGKEEQILFKTEHLGDELPEDSSGAIAVVELEMRNLLSVTKRIFDEALSVANRRADGHYDKVMKLEALNDYLDEHISKAMIDLSKRELTKAQAKKALLLTRISNSIEILGDLGKGMGMTSKRMADSGIRPSAGAMEVLNSSYYILLSNLEIIENAFPNLSKEDEDRMRENDGRLRELINKGYAQNLELLATPDDVSGSILIDMLSGIESFGAKIRESRKLLELYSREQDN